MYAGVGQTAVPSQPLAPPAPAIEILPVVMGPTETAIRKAAPQQLQGICSWMVEQGLSGCLMAACAPPRSICSEGLIGIANAIDTIIAGDTERGFGYLQDGLQNGYLTPRGVKFFADYAKRRAVSGLGLFRALPDGGVKIGPVGMSPDVAVFGAMAVGGIAGFFIGRKRR